MSAVSARHVPVKLVSENFVQLHRAKTAITAKRFTARKLNESACSFVTQCFDGIEVSGAIGGVETKGDADCRADEKARNRPAVRENQIHFEPRSQQIADDDSKNDSEHTAGLGNEDGLG